MAIKYLVINHEQTANLKTVIAYDVPPAPLGVGYLNFDDADGNANTADISVASTPVSGTNNYTHQVGVSFEWGGVVPQPADFALSGTPGNPAKLKKTGYPADTGDVVVTTSGTAGTTGNTGSVTLLFAENDGFAQTQNLVYSGNISHPDQNTTGTQGYNILDITQNGQQISQGKNQV